MIFSLFRKRTAKLPKAYKNLIEEEAIYIIQALQDAGFESYLVGGCVRDILLEKKSKDFDIATVATPEQVKACVARSQIIGKRFRIVLARRRLRSPKPSAKEAFPIFHERPPLAEYQITTFRRAPEWDEEAQRFNENVYGDAKEDALRRDFTINALLLDPRKSKIVDFVNGTKDIQNKQLRVIGDPHERFKEDPIRMLRAMRFCKRAGLNYEKECYKALRAQLTCLKEAKKERIREEILKIWREGHTDEVFQHMAEMNAWSMISPLFSHRIQQNKNAFKQLLTIANAVNKTPWKQDRNAAPFFFLMAHEHYLDAINKDKSKFEELFTRLNVSKKEFEDMKKTGELLRRLLKEKRAQKLKNMRVHPRDYEQLSQAFYVLKILSDAKVATYDSAWKKWSPVWEDYKNACVEGLYSHRRSFSPGRGRPNHGPRRPRRSSSRKKTNT